jgi:hypothetical protein
MIRYAVQCKKGHGFEGWFQSSAAFDRQAKRGLVTCPTCGDTKVEKALMAPRVSTSKAKAKARAEIAAKAAVAKAAATGEIASETQVNAASLSNEQKEVLGLMRKLRKEVEANAEYVGPKFAEEARKIHFDEAPARGIYGEATRDDVEKLNADGVPVYPLPVLPEDKN